MGEVRIAPSQEEIDMYRGFKSLRVARRSQGCCYYCGVPLTPATATYDHVIPKSKGGIDSVSNMVLACIGCNHKKDSYTLNQFKDIMQVEHFFGERCAGDQGSRTA